MAAPDVRDRPSDLDWVKQTFLVSEKEMDKFDVYSRLVSDADFKWSDTTIGGSEAINMPYQFTRYADLKTGLGYHAEALNLEDPDTTLRFDNSNGGDGSLLGDMIGDIKETYSDIPTGGGTNSAAFGMGRYYQESIDEHATLVHMRFGVPEYNSMARFLGYFYSPTKGFLANRGGGLAFNIGSAIGEALGFLLMIPALPLVLGGRVYRRMADSPSSKYYYLKPTMVLYRQAVASILNTISVNIGLSPYSPDDIKAGSHDRSRGFNDLVNSNEGLTIFHELLPDIVSSDGFIDFMAVTTRYQRKANAIREALAEKMNNPSAWSGARSLVKDYIETYREALKEVKPPVKQEKYLEAWFKQSWNEFKGIVRTVTDAVGVTTPEQKAQQVQDAASTAIVETYEEKGDERYRFETSAGVDFETKYKKIYINDNIDTIGAFYRAEMVDGGQFVTFRVENPGSMSESFSNSTRESDLASKINSISGSVRNAKFDYGTIIGKIPGVQTAIDALQGMVAGVLDKWEIGGLMGLSGMSFVDIPKQWDSSSANLPRADFTIQLRSVYGNRVSQFFDLYVPLAMIMAGALPLSTGKQSYTSPFICECYSKGRCAIRLGMIESLSITRAVSNLPFNVNRGVTGIDVSFSVVDMSSVMHMPLMVGSSSLLQRGASSTLKAVGGEGAASMLDALFAMLSPSTFQEDNPFLDYMATLSSLSVSHMLYGTRKLQLDIASKRTALRGWRSKANVIAEIGETLPGKAMRYISRLPDVG